MDEKQYAQSHRGATLTVQIQPGQSPQDVLRTVQKSITEGLRYVELRDDLICDEELLWISDRLPRPTKLLSLRRTREEERSRLSLIRRCQPALLDVALELGHDANRLYSLIEPTGSVRGVVSCHARDRSVPFAQALANLSKQVPSHFATKAALPIDNLAELFDGHRWHLQDPQRNLFLPIASDGSGRFRFYRLLLGESLLLNFLRDPCAPLIPDQPTLSEWQTRHQVPIPTQGPIPFAAIVGDPVEHSRTPAHHGSFFARYGMPVLKVRVTSLDLSSDVLSILLSLGLRACAITSPHKTWLRDSIDQHSGMWEVSDDRDPQSAGNTLVACDDGTVFGTSTDGIGLRAAWEETLIAQRERCGQNPGIAVFGGGGLLPLLRTVFPGALFLSVRSGKPRDASPSGPADKDITVLVWSVGPSRFVHNPPSGLRPKLVFDLNYAEDSPARAYAQSIGAQHVDGSLFFRKQADAQQLFWQRHLGHSQAARDHVDFAKRSPQ